MTCGDCAFFETPNEGAVYGGARHGHCHRYPPQLWMDERASGFTFPEVTAADWCGEYKPTKEQSDGIEDKPNRSVP